MLIILNYFNKHHAVNIKISSIKVVIYSIDSLFIGVEMWR